LDNPTKTSMRSSVVGERAARVAALALSLWVFTASSPPATFAQGGTDVHTQPKDNPVNPTAVHSPRPFKITAIDPSALTTPDVKSETSDGQVSKNRVMGLSKDRHFKSGLYSSQVEKASIESYPMDEFMFFLKGGVTLTSSDGTVTEVNAGDAVHVPKGWKGTWDTKGYTKFYVVYDPKREVN
jgi:ethanolamine utilization protein EutQ